MKKLKTILLIITVLTSFFIGTEKVDAASLSLTESLSTSSTVVGNTVTVTVRMSSSVALGYINYSMSYDTSRLTLTSGTQKGVIYNFTGNEKSTTVTFKFKAKAKGTATVTLKVNEALDFNSGAALSGTKTVSRSINIKTQAEIEASYSKNNNLSSLKVSSGTLSPSFNKNTTSYSVTVENSVTSISLSGSREDSKSYVSGLGSHNLDEGPNKIYVKVTAQNGSTKTYTVTITRKELAPINVKTEDGKDLSVVRKKEQLKSPNSFFEESTLALDDNNTVPSLLYDLKDYKITLVGLKDTEGNVSLYRYEEGKYYPYNEIKSKTIILLNKDYDGTIPDDYKETEITINDIKYKAYQKEGSKKYLIYGTNLETGITKLYEYEDEEKTLQPYEEIKVVDNTEITEKRIKKRNYLIIALAALLLITYVGILATMVRNYKKKKKKKKRELEEKKQRELEEKRQKELEEERKNKELKELEEKEKTSKTLKAKKKSDKIEENNTEGKKKVTRKKKEPSE